MHNNMTDFGPAVKIAAIFILAVFFMAAPFILPASSDAGEIKCITVKSKISVDGSMAREVVSPSAPELLKFARSEFLGDFPDIKEETGPDGLVKMTKNFTDLEECVGVLMVQKDLYFTDRYQVRQSLPLYPDEKVMKDIKVRFEFELPNGVIKILKDRKMQSRQFGSVAVNEFTLDHAGNMDLYYQFNNYKPISAVLLTAFLIFIAARMTRRLNFILIPVLAVLIAFVFAAAVIVIIGESPVSAMGAMYEGVFGSRTNFLNMLLASTPLIFTGLAVAFAFNCGLFNIGGEGQVMIGGFAAALVGMAGLKFSINPVVHVIMAIFAAGLAAGLYSLIAGWFRAKFHVHEVISTIMLNYIAYTLLGFLVVHPWFKENGPNPQTPEIAHSAFLPAFFARHDFNYGFILALVMAVFMWFILYRTSFGFNIRSVGLNEKAAEYSGINISKNIMLAMFISGMLAGLAGSERVMGLFHKYNSTAFVGYGFDGIAVSLLVNNNPLGIILSALLFGFLKTGGSYMNREIGVPVELVVIVQAVIIFFIAADKIVRNMLNVKESR